MFGEGGPGRALCRRATRCAPACCKPQCCTGVGLGDQPRALAAAALPLRRPPIPIPIPIPTWCWYWVGARCRPHVSARVAPEAVEPPEQQARAGACTGARSNLPRASLYRGSTGAPAPHKPWRSSAAWPGTAGHRCRTAVLAARPSSPARRRRSARATRARRAAPAGGCPATGCSPS